MTRSRFRRISKVGAVLLVAGAAGLIAACDGGDSATAPAPAPAPAPPAPTPAPEPEPQPPATPAGLRVAASGDDFIEWTWSPVAGADGYEVQFSPDEVFTAQDEVVARTAAETSYRRSSLPHGTVGFLRVRSIGGTGEARLASAWSSSVNGATTPEPPPPPADPAVGGVTAIPAGAFIRTPANYFDLEGKTLTFHPDASGAYSVEVGRLLWDAPGSGGAGTRSRELRDDGAVVNLPFPFPFADRVWNRVYVNRKGNISFQRPEKRNWPDRDPWADGAMRSVAAAVDSRSAAGLEAMIAVLWALHDRPTITVDSSPARVVVTWRGVRPAHDYAPRGENLFQARLYPSGTVELSYRALPERDGFVGLFHGRDALAGTLDSMDDPAGDAPGAVDITGVEMMDNGSTLLARMTLAENVPEAVAEGRITYRIVLHTGDTERWVELKITASGREPDTHNTPDPDVVGFRVRGATIELWISKTLFDGADQFAWEADANWRGRGRDSMTGRGYVRVGEPDRDLDATSGTVAGNVFEVFHYAVIPRAAEAALSHIYQRAPANDEIAVMFTDFRFDDLWSSGAGTGPVNAAVQGIGDWQANPRGGDKFGSDNLLTSMHTVFLGAQKFAESGVVRDREFHGFGHGMGWIAHEAVHRWLVHLDFRNPLSGEIEPLTDEWCRCHWNEYLHTPAMFPVWPAYSSASYPEGSVMGSNVWVENGNGTFTKTAGTPLATGLSALDLYVLGMLSADEVPDTFLLTDVRETGDRDTVRATKVPVRIEDVVAAMGPRVPSAEESRKEFRLGIYLLHPDDRPPRADLLAHAQALHAAVVDYFARATDGRMRVVPSSGPAQAAIRTTSTARPTRSDGGERTPLFLHGGAGAHAHAHPHRPPS